MLQRKRLIDVSIKLRIILWNQWLYISECNKDAKLSTFRKIKAVNMLSIYFQNLLTFNNTTKLNY